VGVRLGADTREIRLENNLIEGFHLPLHDLRRG
jgi:hypothetical protein